MKPARLYCTTAVTMIAFAANSLLCRLALRQTAIDPATFTLLRIVSGAAVLWMLLLFRNPPAGRTGDWVSAFALFAYAAAFSLAYVSLPAGTGALLLFGAVQTTMIVWGFRRGERLSGVQTLGLSAAVAGLIALAFPGLAAPPLVSSLLMVTAGCAWGVYSLRGKRASDAAAATSGNFARAVPFAIALSLSMSARAQIDLGGSACALLSGAIASAGGYILWYRVLPALHATTAASVQLSVPVLAAAGGIALLGESVTVRFVCSAIAVLGGIALVILHQEPRANAHTVKT